MREKDEKTRLEVERIKRNEKKGREIRWRNRKGSQRVRGKKVKKDLKALKKDKRSEKSNMKKDYIIPECVQWNGGKLLRPHMYVYQSFVTVKWVR